VGVSRTTVLLQQFFCSSSFAAVLLQQFFCSWVFKGDQKIRRGANSVRRLFAPFFVGTLA
jgi:hypothetical protein